MSVTETNALSCLEANLQQLEQKLVALVEAYRESERQRQQLTEEVNHLRQALDKMKETSQQAERLMGKLANSLGTNDLTTEELKEWLDQYIKKIDNVLLFLSSQLPK
ncbi:MAG: hypothetical protein RMJ44_06765 [Cytophagales bacterium]|nr:hypothetical protein [Bernardetiaceae bacterium]MDW8210773.1 hypothetical protein [Cytophagales bacterium]